MKRFRSDDQSGVAGAGRGAVTGLAPGRALDHARGAAVTRMSLLIPDITFLSCVCPRSAGGGRNKAGRNGSRARLPAHRRVAQEGRRSRLISALGRAILPDAAEIPKI
jgi:hypothetical protein